LCGVVVINFNYVVSIIGIVMVDGGSEEEVGREEDRGHGDRHLLMG
jgi:hypothetical protein